MLIQKQNCKKKNFLVKTFEQTWDPILRLHKSEDGTTKSSNKKFLRFSKSEDCSKHIYMFHSILIFI